jgi:hypothetical protein
MRQRRYETMTASSSPRGSQRITSAKLRLT